MVAPETGWHYRWPVFPHCWHLTATPWDDTHRGFVFFSLNCMVLDLSCLFILTCKCWHSTTACDGWELIKCAWYMVPNCSKNLAYWVLPFWYINFTVQKLTFLNNRFYYLTTRATNLVCHIWLSSCRPYIHVNENVTIKIFFQRHFTLILKVKWVFIIENLKNTKSYKENIKSAYSPAPRDCTAVSSDPVIITELLTTYFWRVNNMRNTAWTFYPVNYLNRIFNSQLILGNILILRL